MHVLGSCTAAHHSADDHAGKEPPRFTVVPVDTAVDGPGAGVGVLEATERVCRVVSMQPEPRIASALDALGVAVSPELVAEVLKSLSNAGMLALAFFRWAERQEGFRYTAEGFHNLIEALGKIKQTVQILGLPLVVAYGMLISAFCKSGKCDEAIKVFCEMEVSGCMLSPHVYCMVINGLGSEGRLDEALKYFELYKESGFHMEVPTCNAVVGAYCRAAKFQHAFKMVDEMRECKIGPNSRTYDIILHHLIKSQKFEEAYDVFQRMGMDSRDVGQRNKATWSTFQDFTNPYLPFLDSAKDASGADGKRQEAESNILLASIENM
ncbi:Pentatricopeptide repeat-containing protein, partial [Dichanthelium oligosanthes]